MSPKGSRNAASHGTRPPGSNTRFQRRDRSRAATPRRGSFLKHISAKIGEREAALCSISVAELAHGVHRADTSERRKARRAFLDDLKSTVPVYPITGETAELLAKISPTSAVG